MRKPSNISDAARFRLEELEVRLGYRFVNPDLLQEALTHRSAAHQKAGGRKRQKAKGAGSNERLEFIGDRVLGLLMAEWLLERFPNEQEGALGSRLAHLVSRVSLAEIADRLDLPQSLTVAAHEARAGVQTAANVVADALEAVLGAVFWMAGWSLHARWCGIGGDLRWMHRPTRPKTPKPRCRNGCLAEAKPACV